MIGFSMGGLVLRAALKYLTQYKDLMNLFMSLSTPHLGMIPTENCLLNFGLFCLRKIKGFRAVDEIYKGR
jgi:triacylglycerol esterase/lipase EstA (alpha/beta hydrolase family)